MSLCYIKGISCKSILQKHCNHPFSIRTTSNAESPGEGGWGRWAPHHQNVERGGQACGVGNRVGGLAGAAAGLLRTGAWEALPVTSQLFLKPPPSGSWLHSVQKGRPTFGRPDRSGKSSVWHDPQNEAKKMFFMEKKIIEKADWIGESAGEPFPIVQFLSVRSQMPGHFWESFNCFSRICMPFLPFPMIPLCREETSTTVPVSKTCNIMAIVGDTTHIRDL